MNLSVIVNKTFILIYQRLFKFGLMVYVHLIGQSLQAFIKVIFKCNSIYLRLQNHQRISFQSEKAKLLDCLIRKS